MIYDLRFDHQEMQQQEPKTSSKPYIMLSRSKMHDWSVPRMIITGIRSVRLIDWFDLMELPDIKKSIKKDPGDEKDIFKNNSEAFDRREMIPEGSVHYPESAWSFIREQSNPIEHNIIITKCHRTL